MVTNVTDSKCYSFPTRRSSDLRLSRSERRHPAAAAQPAFDDNLADENHNSVYRDYHYQRLNMGSAPGLRSIHPRVGLSLRDPGEAPDRVRPMSLDRSHFFDFGTPLAFAIVGVLQGAILRSMFHGLRGVFL